jgi:hypothetical protein
MKSFIFIRGLRHVDHSVFCVESGQKTYWDPIFENRLPYSSGQQVKRSVIELIGDELQSNPSAVEFVWGVSNKGALEEKEVLSLCDPQYYDQIIGGWMAVAQGGKSRTLKRRSPLSISAMRPLHPTLGRVENEKSSFDRSNKPELHKVTVRDVNGNIMNKEEIESLLDGTNKSLFRKWIPAEKNGRAYGLFIYDIAIDLRTLFCVQTNQFEPEITPEKVEELKTKGWIVSKNTFGECLVMPKDQRDKIIPAIAKALINWRISSNQARTFSLMETLAVAVSQNANTLAGAIRAKLVEDERRAKPIIDETAGANLYITLPCSGYIVTESESADALEEAEAELIRLMSEFDYENQL